MREPSERGPRIADATEPHPATAALEDALATTRKSEEHFRTMLATIPTLAWCTRADGYAEYYSQRWYEYTGLPFEEAKGHGWTVAIHPDDLKTIVIGGWRCARHPGAAHIAEEISIERLAELVELSSSHFSHVFKETTGMTPLQFVTRERITRAQQMIRETTRSLIEIGLEIGYTSPSHVAQVFRRVVGVTPTEFRNSL